MTGYREISPYEIDRAAERIGKEWMLITAWDAEQGRANAMTASWGCLGVLWNKCVAVCFIRPQRHTFGLAEREERLSLCFLGKGHRQALGLCGKESGRDGDKLAKAGLTVADHDGVPVIGESELILVCRKLYADDLRESAFVDPSLLAHYEQRDYHRMYICEIEHAYLRETEERK